MGNKYNKKIGYSSLACVDEEKIRKVIQVNKQIIKNYYLPKDRDLILVAGAGRGDEALLLQEEFGIKTIGIDINIEKSQKDTNNQEVMLQKQDLMSIAFGNAVFSLVYSYHVLEHVNNHITVLKEIFRVLRPSGVLFIGFPNKNRLLSYIGTSQKASIIDKVKWNVNDYYFRFKGKFDNKFGAHAGFSQREFMCEASKIFEIVIPVRNEYMLIKYKKFHSLIKAFIRLNLAEFIFPSNYFVCIKSNL